jgi:hypothetical protein
MAFRIVNLLDLLQKANSNDVHDFLCTFSCPLNAEIEDFIKNKSIDFSRQKISITHLVLNDQEELAAFFSLTQRSIDVGCDKLSMTVRKKLMRHGIYHEDTNRIQACAYLIAQFGKNFNATAQGECPTGDALMEMAFSVLIKVQHNVGGGVAFLECENRPKLLDFYRNEHNNFHIFGEREADNGLKYHQLMHIFNEKTFAN